MTPAITQKQTGLLTSWLGPFTVVHDHSWPLQDTTVLQLSTRDDAQYIVKASLTSHHIRREIAAYSRGLPGLEGRVPVLKHASAEAGLLVTAYLPGSPVAGTPAESEPETYRQAGALLAALHSPVAVSSDYPAALARKTRAWIQRAQGLLPEDQLARLSEGVTDHHLGPVQLVTTHGDYQPRNWLRDGEEVRIIDFGRAELRPWVHDLVRLSHQQLLAAPRLQAAFFEGLGRTVSQGPEGELWRLENINQAVGTVVWAHQTGDSVFEQQGVRMVERVLTGFEPYRN
ncbi:phosphotransferase [Paenarthrobacter sp. NPDC056912]|uniref:phosphotransferase n=1 Tax=Paenarthrobacter sp. NPDC056912 TaxID=3345965 RepID=UPI00366F7CD0